MKNKLLLTFFTLAFSLGLMAQSAAGSRNVQAAMKTAASQRGSSTHPGQYDRLVLLPMAGTRPMRKSPVENT